MHVCSLQVKVATRAILDIQRTPEACRPAQCNPTQQCCNACVVLSAVALLQHAVRLRPRTLFICDIQPALIYTNKS